MQFLKTIFWVALAVIAAIFSFNNWTDVQVSLFGGMIWQTKLPVPLFLSFLVGLIPALVLHRATRWSLKRKLSSTEKALSDVRSAAIAAPAPVITPKLEPVQASPLSAKPPVSQ